jgi:hypothetical protein
MVGYASDHPDRVRIEKLDSEEIAFDIIFLREDDGRIAVQGEDYEIREHPRAMAHKLSSRRPPTNIPA